MKILEIHVFHFGRIKNRSISLRSGINIISGGNEAGKTTTFTFIKSMLFGLTASEPEYQKYYPWEDDGIFGGSMSVEIDGVNYEIERNFLADSQEYHLWRQPEHVEVEQGEAFLSAALCGLTKSMFENSVCVGQTEYSDGRIALSDVQFYVEALTKERKSQDKITEAISQLEVEKDVLTEMLKHNSEEDYDALKIKISMQENLIHQKRLQWEKLQEDKITAEEEVKVTREKAESNVGTFENITEQDKKREMLVAKEELSNQGIIDEKYLEKENSLGTFLMTIGILGTIIFAFLMSSGRISQGKEPTLFVVCIIALSIVFLSGLILTIVRGVKKGRIHKEINVLKKSQDRATETEAAYQAYVNQIKEDKYAQSGHLAALEKLENLKKEILSLTREIAEDTNAYREQKNTLIAIKNRDIDTNDYQERLDGIALAIKTLEELHEESRSIVPLKSDSLPDLAAGYLYQITGIYTQIRINGQGEVEVGVDNEFVPVVGLSVGARCQTYLALRLASSSVIDLDRKIPLMFDDTFAYFDKERMESSLNVIRTLGVQVIIFSCHTREGKTGKK